MVCDGSHYASTIQSAVTRHVETALVGWGVASVDVVPRAGVGELRDVSDFVGEESGFRNVLAVEEAVGKLVGGVIGVEG